ADPLVVEIAAVPGSRRSIAQSHVHAVVAAEVLGNVELRRPAPRQHPERRPGTLAGGETGADLHVSVGEVLNAVGVHETFAPGIPAEFVPRCLSAPKPERAVLDV